MSALDTQINGNHYKVPGRLQPLELTYLVNGSPCFCKLSKYGSRIKKDRLGDLKKAVHCIQLEKELIEKYGNVYRNLRVDSDIFVEALSLFTKDTNLYNALYHMYYESYDFALLYVREIIEKEFPDEQT